MNTFINLVKKSLVAGGTRDEVRALGKVVALVEDSLLPTLDYQAGL